MASMLRIWIENTNFWIMVAKNWLLHEMCCDNVDHAYVFF